MPELVVGTRGSRMARMQARRVMTELTRMHGQLRLRLVEVANPSDAHPSRALERFGRTGIFTSGLETALLAGRIDLAVHSLKDLPLECHADLAIAAVLARDDPADALVTPIDASYDTLAPGARIGTSSPRRARLLRALDRAFHPTPIRGNVDTRLRKLDRPDPRAYEALMVAACGLERLGLGDRIAHRFDVHEHLTAPGQGALAIQCRADDRRVRDMAGSLDHEPTRLATAAERELLQHMGGGCALPVAAFGWWERERLHLKGLVIAEDGHRSVRAHATGDDPMQLGRALAESMEAQGGQSLL